MTCDEFRKQIAESLSMLTKTRGERMAFLTHSVECQDCETFLYTRIDEVIHKLGPIAPAVIAKCVAESEPVFRGDVADPEAREMYFAAEDKRYGK
jgi:hypothetical protein